MLSYQEQLSHPLWQRKRLTIMERDNFSCQSCGTETETLTVHHRYYKKNEDGTFLELWGYPDTCFTTLCESCHQTEEEHLKAVMKTAFFSLREALYSAECIDALAAGLLTFSDNPLKMPEVLLIIDTLRNKRGV